MRWPNFTPPEIRHLHAPMEGGPWRSHPWLHGKSMGWSVAPAPRGVAAALRLRRSSQAVPLELEPEVLAVDAGAAGPPGPPLSRPAPGGPPDRALHILPPPAAAASGSGWVAVPRRTSTRVWAVAPTRRNSLVCRNQSSFDWRPSGISPISSTNTVPPSASARRPSVLRSAPVYAPTSCPK